MSNAYVPKYTTVEAVSRKLNTRLKFALQSTNPNTLSRNNSIAQVTVDTELVQEVIEEAEGMLDSYLCTVYKLPLQNKHIILKTCVDGIIMADLMQYHFTINGYAASQDVSGFGVNNKQESYQIIRALTHGYNTAIPAIGTEYIPRNPVQPIILVGEQFLDNRQNKYLPTDQYTIVDKVKTANSISDITFGPEECGDKKHCGIPFDKNGKVDEDENTTCIVPRPF